MVEIRLVLRHSERFCESSLLHCNPIDIFHIHVLSRIDDLGREHQLLRFLESIIGTIAASCVFLGYF